MLRFPQDRLERFAEAVERLKKDTKMCERCFNVDEESPCRICSDRGRNSSQICVVETPLDLLALERSDGYTGVYHVLHGVINPLNNIGPNDIYLPQLLKRIKEEQVDELIIATNPSMEGRRQRCTLPTKLRRWEKSKGNANRERFADRADLEYADDTTLSRAMEGRKEME